MPIFRMNRSKAMHSSIKEDGFGSEAELRDFFAGNLVELLGVRFLDKEYPTPDGRIDTLGLDENNAPVIIEYKWREHEEILAQGLFYFNWLMKSKRHFELLVANKLGKSMKVSWDQPRVVLIAQGFSRYVLGAVQQERNVELKAYAYYEPDILQLENVYSPSGIKEGVRTREKVGGGVYNLEHHLSTTSTDMRKLASLLRSKILELPGAQERSDQKTGVTYRTTKSFARFEFRPKWIQLLLRDPSYKNDVKLLVKDITSNEWGYKGMVKLTPESDVDYIFCLVKQSYGSTL